MADETKKDSIHVEEGKLDDRPPSARPPSVHYKLKQNNNENNTTQHNRHDRGRGSRDTVLWCALICTLVYIFTMNNNNNNNINDNNNSNNNNDIINNDILYKNSKESSDILTSEKTSPKPKPTRCEQILRLSDSVGKLNPDEGDVNVTVSLNEVQELRQKVAMYERLNKLLEFNSWMSQHGSKMRQNILILSSQYCGSSLLGEIFNQNSQVGCLLGFIILVHCSNFRLRIRRILKPSKNS